MPKISKNLSLSNAIIDYIDYCSYKNLSKKTIQAYFQTLTLFAEYCKTELNITDVNQVTKEIVEQYISFTKERGKYSYTSTSNKLMQNIFSKRDNYKRVSDCTLNNYLRNIKAFFSYFNEENIYKNNIHEVKYIKTQRKAKEQITDVEYKRLLSVLDKSKFAEYRDFIICNTIFDTGMRLSETLALTVDNVNLKECSIILDGSITKSKKDRVVFFSRKMQRLLKAYITYKDCVKDSDLLFPTQNNTMLKTNNFESNFKKYLKRAKINKNITPHSLRNNFARRFLLNGGDIYTLSRILGHSSVKVTENAYLDLQDKDIRKMYNRYSPLENM